MKIVNNESNLLTELMLAGYSWQSSLDSLPTWRAGLLQNQTSEITTTENLLVVFVQSKSRKRESKNLALLSPLCDFPPYAI